MLSCLCSSKITNYIHWVLFLAWKHLRTLIKIFTEIDQAGIKKYSCYKNQTNKTGPMLANYTKHLIFFLSSAFSCCWGFVAFVSSLPSSLTIATWLWNVLRKFGKIFKKFGKNLKGRLTIIKWKIGINYPVFLELWAFLN